MRKLLISVLLATIAFFTTAFASKPVDLLQVYHQALISDQTFQSAKAVYEAATEAYPQALALLLPEIGLTGSVTATHTRNFADFGDAVAGTDIPNTFNSRGYNYILSASQPVIDFGSWYGLLSADYSVKEAAATYAAAAQDLILRTAQAYFNILLAQDTLLFTEAERDSTERQLDQAKQRFNVGLDAITSVYDAQASYDDTVARVIAGKNDVENTKEQLREITNVFYDHIASLRKKMPLLTPKPNNVNVWLKKANHYNFQIQAAKFALEQARMNIKVAFAGHLPTVDVTGSLNRTKESGVTRSAFGLNDDIVGTAGLSLNLPIFQGGAVTSQVRQAQDEYQNAVAELENAHRQVDVQLRQTYNSIIAGISKIKADKQTVKSRAATLESTEAALKVGTRTIVDLLIAQQQLFQAQTTLAEDQYTYINDTLLLKQLAGTLSYRDIKAINTWLEGQGQKESPYDNPDYGHRLIVDSRDAKPIVKHITEGGVTAKKVKRHHLFSHHKSNKPKKSAKSKHGHQRYSIQLMAMKNKSDLKHFVKKNHLGHNTKIYKTHKNHKTWYALTYGEFTNYKQVKGALRKLPNYLKHYKPYIVKIN